MSANLVNTTSSTEASKGAGNGTKPTPIVPDHELVRRIGEGGYGEVWLARSALGTYRAVKVVYRLSFKDEVVYEREFRGIQKFEPISRSNDGLLDILQAGRNDGAGYYYYVMELADDAADAAASLLYVTTQPRAARAASLENANTRTREHEILPSSRLPVFPFSSSDTYVPKTLAKELVTRGRLPATECVQLALNLTLALSHLHRHGLIHRDIKPSNIIFVGGIPKLADIGLVTTFDETCSFVGTEGFIAPEGPTSPRADLFSLGKVLYEISTGKDRKDFPEPATGLGEQGDPALEELNAIVLRACASDPEQRYQSAEEFHADLALLQSGKSVRWKRVVERRLALARKSLAVVGLVAVLAIAAYFFQRRQTREVERNLYVAHMNLAQRDWDKANPERLFQLLSETEKYPDKGFEWYFWQRQLRLDLRTLRGHTGTVSCVTFSPDGENVVTGGVDQMARVWNVASGEQLFLLKGHHGEVSSVTYSPDGRQILTASHDGTVFVWDALNGQQLRVLIRHTGIVFAIAMSSDGERIATASRDSNDRLNVSVAMWDARSAEKLRGFGDKSGAHGTSAVALSSDGRRIAAITAEYEARVWDAASGRELCVCRSQHEFYSIAFSPDGQRLVTGSDETVVWNAATGERLRLLEQDTQRGVFAVAYSPDGKQIFAGGGAQGVIVWDAESGKERFRLSGHLGAISSVAVSPDGRHIATASNDGTARIWNSREVQNPRTFPQQTRQINMLAISPDGKRIATATWDEKRVFIWDVASGKEVLTLTGSFDSAQRIAFSPDGQRIATGNGLRGSDGQDRAQIWDAATGRELLTLKGTGFVAFSPDTRRIATSSGSRAATIWDAVTGDELVTLNGHSDWVQCGVFSPDGKRVATADGDRHRSVELEQTIKIWDATTGRELLTIKREDSAGRLPRCLVFSPDGRRIALACDDRTPRIWDARSGRQLLVLSGHVGAADCIGFSPDGKRIVTTSYDRSAKIWDAVTGRELLTLEGHTKAVRSAAFFPDGRRIATAGNDGAIRIWEAASPEQVSARRVEE